MKQMGQTDRHRVQCLMQPLGRAA